VHLNASRGLQPQAIANSTAQASIRDPLAYGPSQQLGAWMRDQGIGAFEYFSTEISADHTTFLCLSRVNPLGRFATTKLAGECPQVVAGDNLGAATRKLSYPAARSLISTGFS
jgi:hypothetical protein